MRALVVYDSQFGNTKIIAEALAKELDAKLVSVADVSHDDLEGINFLVVGSPVNGWRPSKKMRSFLASLRKMQLTNVKATAFDTRVKIFLHGNAANKIARNLQSVGAEIVSKPHGFYTKGKRGPLLYGEIERAKEWAKIIKATL